MEREDGSEMEVVAVVMEKSLKIYLEMYPLNIDDGPDMGDKAKAGIKDDSAFLLEQLNDGDIFCDGQGEKCT